MPLKHFIFLTNFEKDSYTHSMPTGPTMLLLLFFYIYLLVEFYFLLLNMNTLGNNITHIMSCTCWRINIVEGQLALWTLKSCQPSVLHAVDEKNQELKKSAAVCSALQPTGFWSLFPRWKNVRYSGWAASAWIHKSRRGRTEMRRMWCVMCR